MGDGRASRGKLEAYLPALAWWHAQGGSYKRLSDQLKVGIETADGSRLAPVAALPDSVAFRLRSPQGKKLLREYRLRLYGEPYAQPLAHSGRRLEALSEALAGLEGERCEECGRGGALAKDIRALVSLITAARQEELDIGQGRTAAVVTTRPEAAGSGLVNRGVIINVLAEGLAELVRVGHADAVLATLRGTALAPAREAETDPPPATARDATSYMGPPLDQDTPKKIPEYEVREMGDDEVGLGMEIMEAEVVLEKPKGGEVESVVEVEELDIFGGSGGG